MTSAPTTTQAPATEAVSIDGALYTAGRPQRPGLVSTVLTFAWRGALKIKHLASMKAEADPW
jgi:ABC-2 type transport system permease protein